MSTPPYVVSIAVDDVIVALGAFLLPFVPGGSVIRAQANRVAMPPSPFAKLTEILQVTLETPIATGDGVVNPFTLTGPTRIDIQIDFYGPRAGDYAKALNTVYRTSYATAQFPANIKPLYCSDAHQSPLTTAEQQYETRWTVTASVQYNPVVTVPMQSANKLAMNIVEDQK